MAGVVGKLRGLWRRDKGRDDVFVDAQGRRFEGPRALYDMVTGEYPAEAPFGAQSVEWLAVQLSKFNAERLQDAATFARSRTSAELREPEALRAWLGVLWDAVSRELDCTELSDVEREELRRLESNLAQSVHVLRPIVGY